MSLKIYLVVAVLAACVIGYLQYRRETARRGALAAFAASKGWSYSARDDSWAGRFTGTPFGRGDHRQARNIVRGTDHGHELVAFDYSYQTHDSDGSSTRSSTCRFTVCALALPAVLPHLELTPESVLSRIGGTLGLQDIQLESEDFNRRYRVTADDPKFAYDVLSPRTMQALLTREPLHLRIAGSDALCWAEGRSTPVALLARLSALTTLLAGIPSYVWSDHTPGGALP